CGSIGRSSPPKRPMPVTPRLLPFLVLAAGLSPQASAADPVAATSNPVQALHCERLFDARSGRVLGEHTILVEDGRIRSLQPGRTTAPGAETIDLAGRTCLPGWTDLHVHLGGQSSQQSYSEGFRLD